MVGKKKKAEAAAAVAAADEEEAPSAAVHESKKRPRESLEAIQADVSLFAASLGLGGGGGVGAAALTASSGFDDSDFRKKGPLKKREAAISSSASEGGGGSGRNSGVGKKRRKSKDSSEAGADKVLTKKRESGRREEKDEDEEEVKPTGRKKERSNKPIDEAAAASSSRTEVKKDRSRSHIEPQQKSKIHEVLDSALVKKPAPDSKTNGGGKYLHVARPPSNSVTGSAVTGQTQAVQKLRLEAEQLMEKAAQQYERSRRKDSDANWLMTIRRSGTSADKVAAMTVILQENPKANVRTLDALIGMLTSKAGKRHAATGIDALKELFIYNLLPDRKLKYFAQQPVAALDESTERASTLVDWYWEDCLKHRYENFVHALEEATKDTLFYLKEKALKTVFELLKSKPEQERRLLSALVNKLGDPDRKMASNASYLLSCLLTSHPNMKKVVIDEVEAFVFRPNVGLRARHYATIFLNQTLLSNKGDGPKLAKQLIDLYFALFKVVTSVVDDVENDTREKGGVGRKKASGRGKSNGFVKDKKSADFTMEIDSRLLSALLTGVNRALPYIRNEDLDSITQDNDVLFRLVHSPNFNLAVQALMLLHQLLTKSQAISDRFYRALYSVLLSKEVGKSSKAEMFLGLVFKAVKSDVDIRRMCAFAKRLLQVAVHQPPQFTCGCLFLLSELLKARPGLWSSAIQTEDHDEEEHFQDVKEDEADDEKVVENQQSTTANADTAADVWPKPGSYDPKGREPLYCNAHRTCWWELSVLAFHIHPSVSAMARTLLSGANIVYDGDPLRDLALGFFLDRFTERKPKPLKVGQAGARQGSNLPRHPNSAQGLARPIGEEFLALAEDQVAPEDLVFHKFYLAKSTMSKKPKQKKKKKGGDDEDDVVEDLLGDDAVEGEGDDDNSEDEEVDALLEQEADLEMDDEEEDISDQDEDGADSDDDDDILLNQEDDAADGSEVDEFDDSEDEEAEDLLETGGLSMSSDDDDVEGDAGAGVPSLGKKKKKKPNRKITVDEPEAISASEEEAKEINRASKVQKSKIKGDVKGKNRQSRTGRKVTGTNRDRRKVSSVFQEAPSDDDDF